MKIVLLLEDLLLGGTQRQALELASGFCKAGCNSELWTLTAGDQLSSQTRERSLPVRKLGIHNQVTFSTLLKLGLQLRRSQPDILLLLTVLPNIWGRIVGKLCFQPVIIGACRGGGAPFRQHEKFLWPLAKHIICNSQALKTVLTKKCHVPASRVSLIYNGINTKIFFPASEPVSTPIILSVGRLVPDKEQETLIRALALVQRKFPTCRLRIVGDGPLKEYLLNLATSLLSPGSFEISPGTLAIAPIYRQAKIFALSSAREGLPNVILEAMASGLPIVSTDVGGIPELVNEGQSGFLVTRKNHQAMSQALCNLLTNQRMVQDFGCSGKKILQEKFSLHTSLTAHLALFHSLLNY